MSYAYIHHQWQTLTWYKAERNYQATLQQNLFGDWILIRRWGVSDSRRGGAMESVLKSYDEGLQQLEQIAKRRKFRGYKLQG